FAQVNVDSPNEHHRRAFAQTMSARLRRQIGAAESPKDTVQSTDLIQAARAAWDPVFDRHWVDKGAYVASIGGADASSKRREIDDETIRRADIYIVHSKEVARLDQSPDTWEAAEKGIKDWDSIHEIQDLLTGKVAGRTGAGQTTLFNNNTGAGVQFAALGSTVLKRARELGL